MPQMMPINWLLLLLIFIITFIIFNILNYFIFNIKFVNKMSDNKNIQKKKLIWKW